jgi:hypothetical protein
MAEHCYVNVHLSKGGDWGQVVSLGPFGRRKARFLARRIEAAVDHVNTKMDWDAGAPMLRIEGAAGQTAAIHPGQVSLIEVEDRQYRRMLMRAENEDIRRASDEWLAPKGKSV